MRRSLFIIHLLLILLITSLGGALPPTEYQIKSALIFNFIKFVEFDQSRYKGDTVILCSFNGNELNEEVRKLNGLNISGFSLKFSEVEDDNKIDDCSVLVVDKRDEDSLKRLLEKVYEKKILTISDKDGYGEKGIVFNMYLQDEKVKFEVNIEAANKSGVKISSRLLAIAKIIKTIK